ncbi:hypothetical protein [Bacillus mycoides]|uniref:hypothetical protein n=1 Tax=Bacillus mycoides TaxID=1405 RepID=UPI00027C196B|nr:hypothetical protein [Bacillus mycoides]EJV59359.1 hypothetical protein IEU_05624 [Bacillus mycoides]
MKTFSMDLTKEAAETIIGILNLGSKEYGHDYAAVKFMKVELSLFIREIEKEE